MKKKNTYLFLLLNYLEGADYENNNKNIRKTRKKRRLAMSTATSGQFFKTISQLNDQDLSFTDLEFLTTSGSLTDFLKAVKKRKTDKIDRDKLRSILNDFFSGQSGSCLSNKFADEEVSSSYGYLSGYTKPIPVAEQVQILKDLFPDELKDKMFDENVATNPIPEGAEGYFAIPKWQLFGGTYHEACNKILSVLSKSRNDEFTNYINIDTNHLRESEKKISGLQKIADMQKGNDILVISAQFGVRHRGRSVRRAIELMTDNEIGLGMFEIAIMLLTHPNRLKNYNDLWIDCAGDEYSDDGSVFGHAPLFNFDDDKLKLNAYWPGDAIERCGSVSVFVSQI